MIINYWAVLAAAVAHVAIGMLWYGPVFGKQWMGLMGFTPESMKSMKLTVNQAIAGGFITALVMAYVLAWFVLLLNPQGASGALTLAFWIWLGFFATVQAGSFLWEGKSANLFFLNTAHSLISLGVMTLILTLWQ